MILKVYKSVGLYNLTLSRPAVADEPSREQLPCKRRKGETDVVSVLANSENKQDGAEPANGPRNSATISLYPRGISHAIAIQKIPTI